MVYALSSHFAFTRRKILIQHGKQKTPGEVSNKTTVEGLKGMIAKELRLPTENMELRYRGNLLEQEDQVLMKDCDMHVDAHPVVEVNYR